MMKALIAAYILAGIITFGHAFNTNHRVIEIDGKSMEHMSAEANTIGAMMCGAFWPLYWSVEAFKPIRESKK